MNTLPDSLSRRSIAAEFDKLTPVAWEKLFAREDQNGIAKLRVLGDLNNKAYYRTEGIIHWLVRNSYYTRPEIDEKVRGNVPRLVVRQHVMAG